VSADPLEPPQSGAGIKIKRRYEAQEFDDADAVLPRLDGRHEELCPADALRKLHLCQFGPLALLLEQLPQRIVLWGVQILHGAPDG
jgi:hypothetical protein